jgi:tRNA pseudouridine13 synthase
MNRGPALPDWQRAYGGPVLRGRIRSQPSDFQVSEILDFQFTGDGEHDCLHIEKTGANTSWVARGLAKSAGVPVRDVGYAGLKDRAAITRQWFSVRRPTAAGTNWSVLDLPGVRVLSTARNQRKLRRGAHIGNEFRIALRDVGEPDDRLSALLQRCRDEGVPNYFGEQRFGRDGGNIELARSYFAGRRLKREQRSIAISAARSLLFNRLLEYRITDGSWNRLRAGELVCLDGSGSVFPIAEPDEALLERSRELDIHPSGPLWGKRVPTISGEPFLQEQAVAGCYPDLAAGLERYAEQSRRALRLAVRNLRWSLEGDVLWLQFFLARGGFATSVLREIADYRMETGH